MRSNKAAVQTIIIDQWQSLCADNQQYTVLPDGCRDVIYHVDTHSNFDSNANSSPGFNANSNSTKTPAWHISPYFHRAQSVQLQAGRFTRGFRLAPGTLIDENQLLQQLQCSQTSEHELQNLLADFASHSKNVQEALACIAQQPNSVTAAAQELGVHARTLQRLLAKETHLPPSYWLRLSRIRHAGRRIAQGQPFADIAALSGFSDQAHLSRECLQWFGVTPTQFGRRPDLFTQLDDPAFA